MVDTIRALSALQTLYADNDTRAINEQDLRDGLVSMLGVAPYVAKTANYPAVESDEVINVDATAGAVTITLPAVATTRAGKLYTIRKTDTTVNAVIVDGNSAETINDDTTQILFTQNAFITIQNTGAAWIVINSYGLNTGHIYQTNASTTIADSVAETTLIHATGTGTLTLPANFFRVGKTYRYEVFGFISTTGTPTINLKKKLGSTVIAASGAVTLGNNLSNALLSIQGLLTCRTVGASGTVIASGVAGLGVAVVNLYPASGTTVTIDTTAALAISLTAEWGTQSASNTLTIVTAAITRVN